MGKQPTPLQEVFRSRGQKLKMLAAFSRLGHLQNACEEAGIAVHKHYSWLNHDLIYAEDLEIAKMMAADLLDDEIWRRGYSGVERQVGWHQGVSGGTETVYSDKLALARIKAMKPEEYSEKSDLRIDHQQTVTIQEAKTELQAMVERNPTLLNFLKETLDPATIRAIGVDDDDILTVDVASVPVEISSKPEPEIDPLFT